MGWWIDVSIGNDVKGNVGTISEVLPWLQKANCEDATGSQVPVESIGGMVNSYWRNGNA